MFRLEDLTLFIRVAALNNFSDTAHEVGVQSAQVSSAIKRLESTLTIRLFARSARSLRLTPEDEVWLLYVRQMLDVMHAGLQKIQTPGDEVSGTLQIAVPPDLGRDLLLPVFRSFRRRYPALRLRIFSSDQVMDVFKDPINVVFRYGNTEDASYIALPVAPGNRHVLVASPEWAEQNGAPQELDGLTQLDAMTSVLCGRLYNHWTSARNGKISSIQVGGTIMSNGVEVIRRLTTTGEGVTCKSWLDISEDVHDGRLQLLMSGYQGEKVPLNMICPHQKQLSTTVRLLHEAMKARCEILVQS